MKRIFFALFITISLGLLAGSVAAQTATLTSTNMAFNPAEPHADIGQPFTTTVTVTNPANNQAVTGWVWIDRVVRSSTSEVIFDAGSSPSETALSATGTASLSYAIGVSGAYTVDVCYKQFATSGCISKARAFVVTIGSAQPSTNTQTQQGTGTSTSGSATQGELVTLPNPIRCADATCLISQVIRYILGVIAVIATLMFVWGGMLMLTSGGNADQVRKAKETLTWAAIGVIVILMSWVIIRFVLEAVVGTSSTG